MLTKQRLLQVGLILVTLLYLFLLPFALYIVELSGIVLNGNYFLGLLILFIVFCLPASLGVSIYLMWSNYRQGRHRRALLSCAVPFVVVPIVYLICTLF